MSTQQQQQTSADSRSVKAILGKPKITFVLGGPASGKGTQCAKLVEEFGYTHISTGDLMRAEIASGSAEGTEIKTIVSEGSLVPHELTVKVLVKALIANPSKNYLIDGFPRSVAQAEYFEQTVTECQQVLFFNASEDVCVSRCMERAKTSGRADDTEDVIRRRLQVYAEESKPVIDLYRQFSRVREVDAGRDVTDVWNDTRQAMLPQVSFIVGPHASGKTTLGDALCARSNMVRLDFNKFLKDCGLAGSDDEEAIVMALIQHLSCEVSPRVLIEDFPQTEFQAKYFMRNCCQPKDVFLLKCSKDVCQERMISLGESHASYLPSTILSKKVKIFNERCVDLLPYLRSACSLQEICTEKSFDTSLQQVCKVIEPTIVHCRNGLSEASREQHKKIEEELVNSQGFTLLDVEVLRESEEKRGTELGNKLKVNKHPSDPKPEFVVEMLKRIIFSGANQDKFLLVNFPFSPEQAAYFESACAKICAIVYTSANKGEKCIEVPGNMAVANLDAVFQKDFRLKTMREWDQEQFRAFLGQKIDWSVVVGRNLSGKTQLANELCSLVRGKVINMATISAAVAKTLGSEEEPFEGEVPCEKVEQAVLELIEADRAAGEKFTYIFDGFVHKKATDFAEFAKAQFGPCSFWVNCACDTKAIEERYKKKNETEEIGEDVAAELAEQAKTAEACCKELDACIPNPKARINIQTDVSLETLQASLRGSFAAKVVIVNHEKRLCVDSQCANLATKYNMLYLSVYQLIKQNICGQTAIGKQLEACRKTKSLSGSIQIAEGIKDEFCEAEYSAVHFDLVVVMQMIQATIAEKRSTEEYILLEGLCNNIKLSNEDDRLSLRYMDELFAIEKVIGEVAAVISLQFKEQETNFIEERYEVFEAPVVEEKPAKAEGEEGEEEAEAAPAEEEGDAAKPKWDPSEYKWTITNRRAKNLPQVFRDYKGINFHDEVKPAEEFGQSSSDQISKCLDDFCGRVLEESSARYLYQQVIFKE